MLLQASDPYKRGIYNIPKQGNFILLPTKSSKLGILASSFVLFA